MKSDPDYWLCLEPFVHLTEQNGHALFYNTLNRKILEYNQSGVVSTIVRKLLEVSNGNVIRISKGETDNPVVMKFIAQLRKLHMGDLLPVALSQIKPVSLVPQPAFKQRLKPYEEGLERSGLKPENFLHEITFHLNAGKSPLTLDFPTAFFQFPFPFGDELYGKNMDLLMVKRLLSELTVVSALAINICSSDPAGWQDWDELVLYLNTTKFHVKYHLSLPQADQINFDNFGKNSSTAIFVSFPFYMENLNTMEKVEGRAKKNTKVEYTFIISDMADLEKAQQLIAHFNLRNWFFKPYFNGTNLGFFKENVYITTNDIAGSKPDQKQIFSRITFNENDFGKFTIMPDGTIFANVNDPALGNLSRMGVIEMIEAEMNTGKSWERTRQRVSPCSSCVYNFLCPPVSRYEIFMKRYNFCHIYKEEQ